MLLLLTRPTFVLWMMLGATAPGPPPHPTDRNGRSTPAHSEASSSPKAQAMDRRITLKFDEKTVVVRLQDTPSTRALLAQLPLTLKLSDHANTEKIAYLPEKLSTEGAPEGFDPSVGDVTYYAPWGNLAIFYEDFGYARGLVPLGVVESGLKDLAASKDGATVVVERRADN